MLTHFEWKLHLKLHPPAYETCWCCFQAHASLFTFPRHPDCASRRTHLDGTSRCACDPCAGTFLRGFYTHLSEALLKKIIQALHILLHGFRLEICPCCAMGVLQNCSFDCLHHWFATLRSLRKSLARKHVDCKTLGVQVLLASASRCKATPDIILMHMAALFTGIIPSQNWVHVKSLQRDVD